MVLDGQLERARDQAETAIETGERLGNDHALCLGLQTLAIVALAEGFVDRAVSVAQRAVTVAERSDAAWANHFTAQLWLGTALADGDRLDEAEVVLQAGRSRAEQAGDVARLPLYHWAIAETRLAGGHWDDALAEAQAGLGLIEEPSSHIGDVFAHALCAHVAFHRGDLILAQSAVDEAHRSLVAGPLEIGFDWMSWIGALLLETQGQPAAALAMLTETWDLIAPLRYLQATSRAMGPTSCGWLSPPATSSEPCRSPTNSSAALNAAPHRPPGAWPCAVAVCSPTIPTSSSKPSPPTVGAPPVPVGRSL